MTDRITDFCLAWAGAMGAAGLGYDILTGAAVAVVALIAKEVVRFVINKLRR